MQTEARDQQFAGLEALLFIHGEPLAVKKIEKILGLPSGDGASLIQEFDARLKEAARGLTLLSDGEKVQLATKPQFHSIIEDFVKEELREDLTPASLETLAIIAYFGPISRSRIEYQRGVNSAFILRSLLLRGLIDRFPDPKSPQSFLYAPSLDLVKYMGLGKKEELPEFEKFQALFRATDPGSPSPVIPAE